MISDKVSRFLESLGAWLLAVIWAGPLLYAAWAAFHPHAYIANFDLWAPLTLDNFRAAWDTAPFARYFLNSFAYVSMTLAGQFVLCTLAAFAFRGGTSPLCWSWCS